MTDLRRIRAKETDARRLGSSANCALHDDADLKFQALSVEEVFAKYRGDEEEITRLRRIYAAKAEVVNCTDGLKLQR